MIIVSLQLRLQSYSAIALLDPQWQSNYLQICIMILIGWDLLYVLHFQSKSIQLSFLTIWKLKFPTTLIVWDLLYVLHQSTGPSLSIQIPSNFSNAITWMGLVLCASFSVHEHPTITSDNLGSDISHHLICHLDAEKGSLESPLLYQITVENFTWLNIQGFIWLYYIPRGSLSYFFNRSSQIEVSIGSDIPGLMVKKCGQRFLYHQDVEEFEQTIIKCSTVILQMISQGMKLVVLMRIQTLEG